MHILHTKFHVILPDILHIKFHVVPPDDKLCSGQTCHQPAMGDHIKHPYHIKYPIFDGRIKLLKLFRYDISTEPDHTVVV